MIGREHDAEGRDNNIETGVGKAQRFRIGFLEFNRQAFRRGAEPAALEQARHIIGGHDVAPAACRGERDVAVSGGDVENLLTGAKVEGFAQLFADDLKRRADDGVVAGRPRGMLAKLQRSEIGLEGSDDFTSGASLMRAPVVTLAFSTQGAFRGGGLVIGRIDRSATR